MTYTDLTYRNYKLAHSVNNVKALFQNLYEAHDQSGLSFNELLDQFETTEELEMTMEGC